jgi:uncharacterized protein YjbI with pentapeptide repeats
MQYINLVKLSIAALPTIVFGVFTIVFTMQQDSSARAMREQDQRQADENNRRLMFKEYIDDMKELLLDEHFDESINQSLLQIRMQTLTVLKYLDDDRKRDVIKFLYENQLIVHDQPRTVNLRGADLTGIKFRKSSTEACNLSHIYLPGIYAQNIQFKGCILIHAVFNDSSMAGATFDSCHLWAATFSKTNLSRAYFLNNRMYQVKLDGAILVGSSIRDSLFQEVDLKNADLYRSDISDKLLFPLSNGDLKANSFLNTRFPNGSFVDLNSTNLVHHGEAQSLVSRIDHDQME